MATQEKSRYLTIIENFKAGNPRYKVLSDRDFSKILADSIPLEAMRNVNQSIPLVKRFVEWLDDDFKLASDTGSALITNINLLPLFDEWSAEYATTFADHYRKKGSEDLNKARQILLDSYVDTEITNMNVENNEAVLNVTEDERRRMAAERVEADAVYSPTYRAAVAGSGVSPVTQQQATPGEFDANAASEDDIDEFDEYLRLIPDSSVYDLAEFEKGFANDEEFSEGFDSSMFAGWLSSKAKNEVTAKKEDGTTAKWSAAEELNLFTIFLIRT